jgi:hypothetical protein
MAVYKTASQCLKVLVYKGLKFEFSRHLKLHLSFIVTVVPIPNCFSVKIDRHLGRF